MTIATPMRRSKALNLPNILTYARLAAVPAVVALLFWPRDDWARWPALIIFIAAGVAVAALGDADERHVGDAHLVERGARGFELALAAVD